MVQEQEMNFSAMVGPDGPTDRQIEYLKATDKFPFTLFGGARGGGKSKIERWRHIRFLLGLTVKGIKNVRTAIFCDTYPNIYQRQWVYAKSEFPSWLGTFHEQRMEFRFHEKWGAHVICFMNLDDAEKYKSAQFATIGVEELTEVAGAGMIIDLLRGSLRWPEVDWTPMGFTTNPDGPSHSTVKALFVTKTAFTHPDHKDKNPNDFCFVRSLPSDNPHLPESYWKENLAQLPPAKRGPWLEGSWDLFEGQRFTFNPAVHVIQHPPDIDYWRPCKFYLCMDHGFNNPFAAGWYAVRPKGCVPQIIKIHEHNESGLKARAEAKLAISITRALGITLSAPAFLDTACWAEEDDGKSIAQKFIEEGLDVQQVLKDRKTGWEYLDDALNYEMNEDGDVIVAPQLQFYPTCYNTITQITDALWDPKKPGDIMTPTVGGSHWDSLDETRYLVMAHFQGPKVQKEETRDQYHEKVQRAMERSERFARRR